MFTSLKINSFKSNQGGEAFSWGGGWTQAAPTPNALGVSNDLPQLLTRLLKRTKIRTNQSNRTVVKKAGGATADRTTRTKKKEG